jgi:ribosomal protein S18 acetylase RimI-like enzyme
MNIEIVETLADQHASQVKQLLSQCFSVAGLSDDQRHERADRFCSQADTWRHVLGLNATDTVVGFATVYRRQIKRNGATVVLGGLGAVCTDPAWRHQGIASAVSAAAVEEMKRAKCDIAYLCAAVDDPGIVRLYGQCGFVPLRRPHTFFGRSGRLYEDNDAMIAPICNPVVYNEVLTSTDPFHIGTGNW